MNTSIRDRDGKAHLETFWKRGYRCILRYFFRSRVQYVSAVVSAQKQRRNDAIHGGEVFEQIPPAAKLPLCDLPENG